MSADTLYKLLMNHLIQGIIPPVYGAHSARWPGCHRVHPTLGRETMLTTLHHPQFITLARKRTRCTEVLQWWGNSKNRRLHKKTSVQGSYGMIKHQRECLRFCVGTADTSNLHEKAKQQRAGPPATLRKKISGFELHQLNTSQEVCNKFGGKRQLASFFFFCPLFHI